MQKSERRVQELEAEIWAKNEHILAKDREIATKEALLKVYEQTAYTVTLLPGIF